MRHTNCHWYDEDKDMGATIPYCRLKDLYGQVGCYDPYEKYECEDYITRKEVDEIIKNLR